jgi:hypothetical protein
MHAKGLRRAKEEGAKQVAKDDERGDSLADQGAHRASRRRMGGTPLVGTGTRTDITGLEKYGGMPGTWPGDDGFAWDDLSSFDHFDHTEALASGKAEMSFWEPVYTVNASNLLFPWYRRCPRREDLSGPFQV